MEDGISIYCPNGKNYLGKVEISFTEIVIYKKNKLLLTCFGLLGVLVSSFEKGKKCHTINVSDIVLGEKRKFGLNKNAYQITMKDETKYILIFDKPQTSIPYLESLISTNKGIEYLADEKSKYNESLAKKHYQLKCVDNGYICPACKMSMDSMSPCERCGYIPPQSN